MTPPLRRSVLVFAALFVALGGSARADVDGGAPGDAGVAALDGAALEAPPPAPEATPPPPPPDLTLPTTSAALSTTMVDAPTPTAEEAEPPRPITRRLWFWLAVSGAIIVGSLVVMATQNPSIERPDCPPGYVCPK